MAMTTEAPIGSKEARNMLGVSKDTLIRMAARGELTPVGKLPGPNGAYLFDRAEVAALAALRGRRAG